MKREFTKLMAALALLLFIAPLGMWGQSRVVKTYKLTIDASDFNGTSYAANNNEKTSQAVNTSDNSDTYEVKWTSYQVMLQSQAMQWQKSKGYIYNSTDLGTITNVTVTSSAGTFTTYYGTSQQPASGTTVGGGYFQTKVGGATGTTSKVEITFKIEAGGTSTHTLTFGSNPSVGGIVTVGNLTSPATVAEGDQLSIVATANTGFEFNGWSVSGTGSSVAVTSNASTTFTMGTANTTLTANFTQVNTYTVTYHANVVGTADVEVVEYNQGATVTVAANSFSNPGYAFTKWTANADGTGLEYQPGATISNIQADIDLYAQWAVSHEVTDVLTRDVIGVTETSYEEWDDITVSSDAVYAGQSAGGNSTSGYCIQLRSSNSNSGIVTTTTGGTVKKVAVVWLSTNSSNRTLNIYGKNSAYTDATDLYDDSLQGDLLGTIVYGTSTELSIQGNYTYVGIRSASGAAYLDEIAITWESASSASPSITVNPGTLNDFFYLTGHGPSAVQSISVSGVNLTDDINVTLANNSNFEISASENGTYGNTLTLNENSGSVATTAVYVRMKSGLAAGNYTNEAVSISSTGATTINITLNGIVRTPMTVAEAIAAIDEATDNSVSNACVQGVVSYVEYYSSTNHYITYYISADGTRNNELEVYHGKNLNGTDFSSDGDLLVGDQVVVYGDLKLYNSAVYEFDADNYLISLTRPAPVEYTLTVSNLSHVNMFVFDASDESEMLFEGEGTAQIYNGSNILLSVEVEEGYGIQSLIVDGVNVASQLDETGAYTFYMPTRNVTITATAEVLPAVILCDDNTTLYGATVTLPTRGNSGDYTFAGWCVTNYEEETTTTPTIIPVGNYQTTQQSIVLYPVYTRTEGGSGTEWHLVTDLTTVGAGVYALLTNENYAFNGTITSGHGQSTAASFTFENGVATSAPSGTLEITFTEVNGGFTMYAENKGYLYASDATSGHLAWHSNESNYWYVDESFIYNKEYTVNNQPAYAHLRVYDNKFRTYYNTTQHNIQLAKKVQGDGTTYYTSLLTSYNLPVTAYSGDKDHYYLISSPVVGGSNPLSVERLLNTAGYDLYRFDQQGDEDGNEWLNYKQEKFNLQSGQGYLYANSESGNITFVGTPYSGNGQVTLYKKNCSNASGNFEGWNLVGNPFPQTAYIDRDCYVMNQNNNQIIATSSREVAIMQGLFVVANYDGEQMTFSTTPLGKADSKVVMNVIDNQGVADRAIVRFGEGSQLPKFQLKGNSTKVYFQQGQDEFAIVAAENEGELPVNFKASSNGRYTMSFDVENLDMNYLHLIDNKTGNDVDLLATPSYTFQANSSDYESRFRLVFDANTVNENNTTTTFAYFNGTEWVVNNNGNATLQVIDMMGRVLSSQTLNGNANVNINQPAGIYMLRLVNGENVQVQKVVVR